MSAFEELFFKDVFNINIAIKNGVIPKLSLKYDEEFLTNLYGETEDCLYIYNTIIKQYIKTYVEKDKTKKYFEKLLKTVYSGTNASIKKLDEIRYSFIKSVLKNLDVLNDDILIPTNINTKSEKELEKEKKKKEKIRSDNLLDAHPYLDTEELYDDTVVPIQDYVEKDPDLIDKEMNDEYFDLEDLEEFDEDDYKPQKFKLRPNQVEAVNASISNNFCSGIHNQIMGAGKTYIALNIIHKYVQMYKTNKIFIIMTDRIDILKSWFMINLTEKYTNMYVDNPHIRYKTKTNQDKYVSKKINDHKMDDDYLIYDSANKCIYGYNTNRFDTWDNDDIIKLVDYNIAENIINKDDRYSKYFDGHTRLFKPVLYIVNSAYLKTKNKYLKINPKLIGLILVDECHSASGKLNYDMLMHFRTNNCSIIGFSATPVRPTDIAEKNMTDIYGKKFINEFGENVKILNQISNYTMVDALKDGIVLPFVHKIVDPYPPKQKYETEESKFDALKLIIEKHIFNNDDLHYKKGVCWASTIHKISRPDGIYYNLFKMIQTKLKIFTSYSGNRVYTQINELDKFEVENNNSILLCVNRVKEGSDIKNLDYGIWIDAVNKRSIISSMQSVGRIMRRDTKNLKKYALILECVKLGEKKDISLLTVKRVLQYYKQLLNLSTLKNQRSFIEQILNLYEGTEVVEEDNSIHINAGTKTKPIMCKIELNIKCADWRIFKEELRTELGKKCKIEEKKLLEREYMALKNKVRELNIVSKNEYVQYVKDHHGTMCLTPEIMYRDFWNSYYDFLGLDLKGYPGSKRELLKKCRDLKISTYAEYMDNADDHNLPKMPTELYADFGTIEKELKTDIDFEKRHD